MTLPNLVSAPPARDLQNRQSARRSLFVCFSAAMTNTNGPTEVAKTPSKEQDGNGQVETEEGANGQLPDST